MMDVNDDSIIISDDVQSNDSIVQPKSPNTNEVVPRSIENSFTDIAEKNDFVASDRADSLADSLHTDDIVRNLVEHTISEEATSLNDPTMSNSSLIDTNEVVHNLVENETENTNLNSNDEVLDSMLESLQDEHELMDSVDLEEENSVPDFSNESSAPDKPDDSVPVLASDRLCQLPLGRIKSIVKADPDVNIISAEVTFLISKSCELFLQWLGKTVHSYTVQKKKKTIQKRDLDSAISEHPALEFLDGALD